MPASKNAQWKRLDKMIDKALTITNGPHVPCLKAIPGANCFSLFRSMHMAEEDMCKACALHWHLTRAQVLFGQLQRESGIFT